MKQGKRYTAALNQIDKSKLYEVEDGLALAIETAKAKFDETVELHIRLGVDGRNADQQVRGVVVLPHGTGKSVKVLVIARGDKADEAAKAGADLITFHYEAAVHHHRIVQQIHALGKKAGISIVPSTPVSAILPLLPFVDLVLVMTVNPGFGGQALIPECLDKVKELVAYRSEKNLSYLISVDGGVNEKNANMVIESGVDAAVSGSAFFSGSLTWSRYEKN